jgi:hypothetical protein
MAIRHRTIAGILAAGALTLWSSRCKNEVTGVSPPPPASVDIRGTWKGTWSGSHCAANIKASATFSQANSAVSATLQPGAQCNKSVTLQGALAGASLTGTVSFTQGPSDYAEKFRGTVTGSVSAGAMTLQIGRLCDNAEDGGCVDGGTLVLEKSS